MRSINTIPAGSERPTPPARRRARSIDSNRPAPRPSAGSILERLYESHATRVYRYIYRKVGNREAAEDLTAQVFVKAAQYLDAGRDEPGQVAWIYQVARTGITDYWRTHYRGGTVSLEALLESPAHHEFAAPAEVTLAGDGDDRAGRHVAAILAALPANHRQVLTLRFLHGCSLKETAAAMNISEGNVKVLQYRALQKAATLRIQPDARAALGA
jgi:RNA polymerase sigma-70 factor (ECF subfamily)